MPFTKAKLAAGATLRALVKDLVDVPWGAGSIALERAACTAIRNLQWRCSLADLALLGVGEVPLWLGAEEIAAALEVESMRLQANVCETGRSTPLLWSTARTRS